MCGTFHSVLVSHLIDAKSNRMIKTTKHNKGKTERKEIKR
jgi:hypothetical protein